MNARIQCIAFDNAERPAHAVILTGHGIVEVEWQEACGDRCWFSAGTLDARKAAVPAINRIKGMGPCVTS